MSVRYLLSRVVLPIAVVSASMGITPALGDLPQMTVESFITGPMFLHQGGGPLSVLFGFQGIPGNPEKSQKQWGMGIMFNKLELSPQANKEYQQALAQLGLHRMVLDGMQVRMIQDGHHQVEGPENSPALILPAILQKRSVATDLVWKTVGAYTVWLRYAGAASRPIIVGIRVQPR